MFSKLNFHVPEGTIKKIVLSTAGVIEPILNALREKIDKKLEQTENILVCTVCLWMCVLRYIQFECLPQNINCFGPFFST